MIYQVYFNGVAILVNTQRNSNTKIRWAMMIEGVNKLLIEINRYSELFITILVREVFELFQLVHASNNVPRQQSRDNTFPIHREVGKERFIICW